MAIQQSRISSVVIFLLEPNLDQFTMLLVLVVVVIMPSEVCGGLVKSLLFRLLYLLEFVLAFICGSIVGCTCLC